MSYESPQVEILELLVAKVVATSDPMYYSPYSGGEDW